MWANRLDGTSGNWGTAVVIGTDPNGSAVSPSVAVSANGTAIVVWNEFDTTSPAGGTTVQHQGKPLVRHGLGREQVSESRTARRAPTILWRPSMPAGPALRPGPSR